MSDLPVNASQTVVGEVGAAVTEVQKIEPQIATMADVGLDAASLAATQIATVAGMKDPEEMANEIVSLKAKVDELNRVLTSMLPNIDSMLAAAQAKNVAALETAVNSIVAEMPDGNSIETRLAAIEASLPDLEKVVTDVEGVLPADWKTHLSALLLHSRQYFGV